MCHCSEVSGDREVQRTMLELLNQLDGFSSDERIKIIAATNRADILDPALMRSGRLDRKIEFPHPSEEARARILQVGLHNLLFLIFSSWCHLILLVHAPTNMCVRFPIDSFEKDECKSRRQL